MRKNRLLTENQIGREGVRGGSTWREVVWGEKVP